MRIHQLQSVYKSSRYIPGKQLDYLKVVENDIVSGC